MSALDSSLAWVAALTDYEAKRAYSDGLPIGHADEDTSIDVYCAAQDYLVENVRAPNAEAVIFKIELAKQRWDGLGTPDDWLDAFVADIRALCAPSSDPHMAWLAEHRAMLAAEDAAYAADPDGDHSADARLAAKERQIVSTPVTSRDGLLAKALLVASMWLGPDDTDDANQLIAEAKRLSMMGSMA